MLIKNYLRKWASSHINYKTLSILRCFINNPILLIKDLSRLRSNLGDITNILYKNGYIKSKVSNIVENELWESFQNQLIQLKDNNKQICIENDSRYVMRTQEFIKEKFMIEFIKKSKIISIA